MSDRHAGDDGAFDDLLRASSESLDASPAGGRGRWLWPTVTVTLSVIGVTIVSGGLLLSGSEPRMESPADGRVAAAESTPVPARAQPSPETTPSVEPAPAPTGISALADPDWIRTVAAAGGIPERALAAYAGAAILLAETRPTCRLGWNTLAAIGFVETEHASMNGAVLQPDGLVTPAIIGIPLDGNGTLAVPDTDGGALDGDDIWDRAVGPMQFTPATWAAEGVDGNGDGVVDINNIDDAVLSAGTHLCNVGGNLSVASNWISAIHAYNPSVEYNNRVAEAANFYASLP